MRGLARKIGWRRVAGVAGLTAAGLYVAGQAGFSLVMSVGPLGLGVLLLDTLLRLGQYQLPLAVVAIAALAVYTSSAGRESLRRLAGGVAILLAVLALLELLLGGSLLAHAESAHVPFPYIGLARYVVVGRYILRALLLGAVAVTLVRWPGVSAAACIVLVALTVWSMTGHPTQNNPDHLAFFETMEEAWTLENMPVEEEDVLLESGGVTDTLTDDVVTVAGEIHVHPNFSTLLVYAAAGLLARQWRRVRAAGEAASTVEA